MLSAIWRRAQPAQAHACHSAERPVTEQQQSNTNCHHINTNTTLNACRTRTGSPRRNLLTRHTALAVTGHAALGLNGRCPQPNAESTADAAHRTCGRERLREAFIAAPVRCTSPRRGRRAAAEGREARRTPAAARARRCARARAPARRRRPAARSPAPAEAPQVLLGGVRGEQRTQ